MSKIEAVDTEKIEQAPKCFVILGGNKLNTGSYEHLSEMGYFVIVIDWNESPAMKGDLHIQADVKDTEKVLALLQAGGYNVQGAMSSIDLAIPTVSAINRHYGWKYQPSAFNKVLTKEQMRQAWERDGLFHRQSVQANQLTLLQMQDWNRQQKLIVKPNVAASSRGITVLDSNSSVEMLQKALLRASSTSFDKEALVEEYVEGREFTVDMLGDDYGHVSVYGISVKYHSENALHNCVSAKLHWNSAAYPPEVYTAIAEMGKKCYRSLGMKNTFGHLEIIMKSDGSFSPVEIGARSSGFIASHLVWHAAGKDYLGDYVKMLHGEAIEEKDHINGPISAMWYGYDIPANTTPVRLSCLAKFLDPQIKVMYFNRSGIVVGKKYQYILDDEGRDDQGYEMIYGPKEILTIENITKAEKAFLKDLTD